MSSEKYVKQAVTDVEQDSANVDQCLPTRVATPLSQGYRPDVEQDSANVDQCLPTRLATPLSQGYRPELDQSRELDEKRGQYYQSLIGVLCWICELRRVNILVAVLMLSRYLVSPREGHLQQVFHLFAYLRHHTLANGFRCHRANVRFECLQGMQLVRVLPGCK
jgi:hypothetical protein